MYPDLSYVFHDFLGTATDNWTSIFKVYGLFLVLAVLGAARILYVELRRKGREEIFRPSLETIQEGGPASAMDVAGSVLWGFFLGFKIPHIAVYFTDFQRNAAEVLLSWEGMWWAGILAGLGYGFYTWYARRNAELTVRTAEVFPHDRIGEITMIAAVAGVIGAKVFSILEDPSHFLRDPAGAIFSGAGLTIYGGLIFGFWAVAYYLRKKQIPLLPVMDAVAPALLVAYGIGRLGCHFSGDGDWGIPSGAVPEWWFLPDWLWGQDYPRNIIQSGVLMENCAGRYCRHLGATVFPTSVYEAGAAFVLAAILWALRKRIKTPGVLFFIYLIFNGLERFSIEKIRVNERYDWLGWSFTQAEIIATALFVAGLVGIWWLTRKGRGSVVSP
jgi:phosphatidylglycerol:prolipoprotein diacylglycerol transferase